MIHLSDLADPAASNNTTVIQDAMNKAAANKVPLLITAGQWKHTGLVIPSGLFMMGYGKTSELYNTANSIALDASSKIDFELRDFMMRGVATVDNTLAYPTVSNTGTGLKVSAADGFNVRNVIMTNIGTGIDYQANGNWGAKGRFVDVNIDYAYKGIYTYNSGEYANFSNVMIDRSTFGFHVDSGNNNFSQCQVTRSGIAVKLSGGTNNGHGQFTSCTFNHNNYALDAYEAVSVGETFLGCHFIGDVTNPGNGSKIRIYNSKGINLVGCHIGANITIDGGSGTQNGANMIANSLIRTELANYAAPVILNSGVGLFKNNFAFTGMWASNN